jgi:hypothetical protein
MLNSIQESYSSIASVFPNPGIEHLNIIFENEARLDGKVYFYTTDGSKVAALNMTNGSVNTSTLPHGIYILQVLTDDHSSTLRRKEHIVNMSSLWINVVIAIIEMNSLY